MLKLIRKITDVARDIVPLAAIFMILGTLCAILFVLIPEMIMDSIHHKCESSHTEAQEGKK